MNFENTGFKVLNWKGEVGDFHKTVVVLGVARSGTTMVAQLLLEMGVNMGDEIDPVVFEDKEIRRAMEGHFSAKQFKRLVEERNAASRLWGWKVPLSIQYLHKFDRYLNNPHYVFVFRDILSIGLRNEIALGEPITRFMDRALEEYKLMTDLIKKTQHPCLLISYEKALASPVMLVESLIEFLGIGKLARERISEIAAHVVPNRPEYVHSIGAGSTAIRKPQSLSGHLNYPGNGIITGWIMDEQYPKRTLYVNIFAGNQIIATVEADTFRPDLYALGKGTGNYGFELDLKPLLSPFSGSVQISAFHAGQPYYHLGGSPLIAQV